MNGAEAQKKSRAWVIALVIAVIMVLGVGTLIGVAMLMVRQSETENNSEGVSSTPGFGMARPVASDVMSDSASEADLKSGATSAASSDSSSVEQKVIKTADVTCVVDQVGDAVGKLANLAKEKKGFVQSSDTVTASSGKKTATVVLKVPAAEFENTLAAVKNLAKTVERENVSGQDVTEEFIDLKAQLKNLQAEEAQLQTFLGQARDVEDLLKVHKQLSSTRSDIERVQGRIKYLEQVTDMSTITAELSEEVAVEVPTKTWKPLLTLKKAFNALVSALQWIVDVLIVLLVTVLPVVLILWLLVWLIIKMIRHRKQKKEKTL